MGAARGEAGNRAERGRGEAAHGLPLLFRGVSKIIDFGRSEAVGPLGRGRPWAALTPIQWKSAR